MRDTRFEGRKDAQTTQEMRMIHLWHVFRTAESDVKKTAAPNCPFMQKTTSNISGQKTGSPFNLKYLPFRYS